LLVVHDPYGLFGSPAVAYRLVMFGDVDVSPAVGNVNVHGAVGEMTTARFNLDARSPLVARVDFTTQVVIAQGHKDAGRMFTGYVAEARASGVLIEVSCSAQPSLREPISTDTMSLAGPLDTMYALMRDAGLPDERINFQGLDRLPKEIFEVVAPVVGTEVPRRVTVGRVALLPVDAIAPLAERFVNQELAEELTSCRAYALAHVVEERAYQAEQGGLRLIDSAIAWMNVRLRYANAVTPFGRSGGWERTRLRQRASRGPFVAVRGLATGRCWIRRTGTASFDDFAAVEETEPLAAVVLDASTGLREATRAAARAITSADPLVKVAAISECLEFYAGSTKVSYGFTKQDRRVLLKAAGSLDPAKRTRIERLVADLNQAPLLARVRARLAEDRVPVTEGDMDTLARVRTHRNDLVHGRSDVVDEKDVERAIALLARILSYAAAAEVRRRGL
jgi:hypothetical protein